MTGRQCSSRSGGPKTPLLGTPSRLLAIVLVALALTMVACGGDTPGADGEGQSSRPGATEARGGSGGAMPTATRSSDAITTKPQATEEPKAAEDQKATWQRNEQLAPTATDVSGEAPPSGNRDMGEASFLDLLSLIPLVEVNWDAVYINDYERAREAHGIPAPSADASGEELKAYIRELQSTGLAMGPWISGYTMNAIAQLEQAKHLGFSIGDVEQSIRVEKGPITLEVVRGRIDPEVTENSLNLCVECEEPEIREHRSVNFYIWGEDLQGDLNKILHPPAFDRVGRGGRIAVLDSLALRTVETDGMRNLIDTYLDRHNSLADDPDLALAAGALERQGVYSAVLWVEVAYFYAPNICDRLDYCDEDELAEALGIYLDEVGFRDSYNLLGTGVGNDEKGFYTVLAFIYENEKAAHANVSAFEESLAKGVSMESGQPWSEIFPEGEAWTEDRVLVARLRTESPSIWLNMALALDSLLWHR